MRKKKMMNRYHYIKNIVMLATMMLAASCGSDGFDDEPQNVADNASLQEIRLNANVWRMMEGTRATTYDNQAALQAEAYFTCYAYLAGSTTTYINRSGVTYAASEWTFNDGKHYWPASGNLDFFAYISSEVPTYITDMEDHPGQVSYYVQDPQFKCVMPMTNSGQNIINEFIYAIATGQNKADQGATGVNLTFQHPFTKIILKLSSTQADIEINKITLKTIKDHGTYSDDRGWSTTGDATNFVAEYSGTKSANADLGTYLMIPQNWTGNIEVEATWVDWGVSLKHTLTTKVDAVTWAPGTSYTYTFTITKTDLIVSSSKYTEQW